MAKGNKSERGGFGSRSGNTSHRPQDQYTQRLGADGSSRGRGPAARGVERVGANATQAARMERRQKWRRRRRGAVVLIATGLVGYGAVEAGVFDSDNNSGKGKSTDVIEQPHSLGKNVEACRLTIRTKANGGPRDVLHAIARVSLPTDITPHFKASGLWVTNQLQVRVHPGPNHPNAGPDMNLMFPDHVKQNDTVDIAPVPKAVCINSSVHGTYIGQVNREF